MTNISIQQQNVRKVKNNVTQIIKYGGITIRDLEQMSIRCSSSGCEEKLSPSPFRFKSHFVTCFLLVSRLFMSYI
jgi:hypothetical protein